MTFMKGLKRMNLVSVQSSILAFIILCFYFQLNSTDSSFLLIFKI